MTSERGMAPEEQRLRAIEGSEEALAQLLRAYQDRVYRLGVRTCHDRFDAEDAVQETFIKLARRPDVQTDQAVLAWLLTTVRNACLRLLRRLRGRAAGDDEAVLRQPSSTPPPDEALDRWRLVDRLHRAIAALPRELREVLILRDIEQIPGPEAAASLGLGEAAMKSRLHRARRELRVRLRDLRN